MSDGITEARRSRVHIGGVYRHFKGGVYVVLACTLDSESPTIKGLNKVTYMDLGTGNVYHRLRAGVDGFTTPKVIDGTEIERFALVGFAEVTIDRRGGYRVTREF